MASTWPFISKFYSLFTKHLGIVPNAPFTIVITVTFMFHIIIIIILLRVIFLKPFNWWFFTNV